jgi:predicted O-methyltransferase YrrM
MMDEGRLRPPGALAAIEADTARIGFAMASEPRTGALLRALAASKPGGRLLELGTGTGIATAWILDGMDRAATLLTVDEDDSCVSVAKRHLAHDERVRFAVGDGTQLLGNLQGERFDLIFADTWPGKFHSLDDALALLAPGALYVIDDLLPQPNWPEDHAPKVENLLAVLDGRADLSLCRMAWSSGIVVATKRS